MERFVLKHLCDKIRKMPTDMGRYWMDFSIFLNKKKIEKKKLLSFPTSYLSIQNWLPYLATQITNEVLKYFYSGIFLSRKCFIEQPISLFTRYAFFPPNVYNSFTSLYLHLCWARYMYAESLNDCVMMWVYFYIAIRTHMHILYTDFWGGLQNLFINTWIFSFNKWKNGKFSFATLFG